jgi:predicted NBD/HSP70 family sugar kinase
MDKAQILKLNNIKKRNTIATLKLLRRLDRVSRVELVKLLNCDRATITRIIASLLQKGIIKPAGNISSDGGRPRENIQLDGNFRCSIGIQLDANFITGVVVDLNGKIIKHKTLQLGNHNNRKEFLKILDEITVHCLDFCNRDKLLGIGVAAFGTFANENKTLENVADFHALENFNISDFFSQNYGIIPEISDTATAHANYITGLGICCNAGLSLLFCLGRGIGCVPLVDGKITFCKNSHGGEFGHTIINIDGVLCNCGRHGCLEATASSLSMAKQLRLNDIPDHQRFSEVVKLYTKNDPAARKVVESAARTLGIAIANQVNSLMPDEVLLTGELLKLGNPFFEIIKKNVDEYAFPAFSRNLVLSNCGVGENHVAIGVATLPIDRMFQNFE